MKIQPLPLWSTHHKEHDSGKKGLGAVSGTDTSHIQDTMVIATIKKEMLAFVYALAKTKTINIFFYS